MRKLIFSILLILLVMPAILSFAAKYYLQNELIDNFAADAEIGKLDFEHGWFNSTAQLVLKFKQQNLVIETNNQIQHGPIIWSNLFETPLRSFALYKVNTDFNLTTNRSAIALSEQPGSAITWVNYLGESHPQIHHRGLDLSIFQTRVFADLADIEAHISNNGDVAASIKTNQLEFSDAWQNFYLVKPEIEIKLNPDFPIPTTLKLKTINFSSQLANDNYQAGGLQFNSRIEHDNDAYHLLSNLEIELLNINQAAISNITTELSVTNLDQQLIDFFNQNYFSISTAVQNNQWLVLLKHFSDLLKLINHNQPEIKFTLLGQAEDQPIKVDFSTRLLTQDGTELNPFSLLENLKAQLETQLPKTLIAKLNQIDIVRFLESMLEKGLLIEKHQSYYASLSFENTKLKVKH